MEPVVLKVILSGVFLLGLVCEVRGLLLMSRRHLDTIPHTVGDILLHWLSALSYRERTEGEVTSELTVRGDTIRGAATVGSPRPAASEALPTLRGLAWIGLGFILQAGVAVVSIWSMGS